MKPTTTVVTPAATATTTTVTTVTTSPKPPMSATVMVSKFLALRDRVEEIRTRQAEELAPYKQAMLDLEAQMLGVLNAQGVESMKSAPGTFFKTTRTSVTVSSFQEVLDFIRATDAWELLEARVSKTAVAAIMEDTKLPVPGVTVTRETVVQVRRTSH